MPSICLAFAEANHGSDLAGVRTRGDIVGDAVFVSGVKTWIAKADTASEALVLCVTEPTARRPENLSCVRVVLAQPGVELRPIATLSGELALFDVCFDGARAPLKNIVGGRGKGWPVATARLRAAHLERVLDCEREFWELVETARRYGRERDPLVRQQLAWAYSQVRILRGLDESELVRGIIWSDVHRRLGEIAVEVMGSDALVRPEGEAYATNRWQHVFLTGRADTIASGTTEIQKTAIAEQILDLRG
jgi:alkylation response protein AidB-like acyl-CoA dehydrogenase